MLRDLTNGHRENGYHRDIAVLLSFVQVYDVVMWPTWIAKAIRGQSLIGRRVVESLTKQALGT